MLGNIPYVSETLKDWKKAYFSLFFPLNIQRTRSSPAKQAGTPKNEEGFLRLTKLHFVLLFLIGAL